MEDILSSIKRIIAEEGDGTPVRTARRQPPRMSAPLQPSPPIGDEAPDHEVLELSDPMPAPRADAIRAEPVPAAQPAPVAETPPQPPAAPIVSAEAAAASRGALDQLSRMMVKPEPGSDGSLEGLVRELLRPLLRDWLDAHLPDLVETMVQGEIRRITGQAG